MKTHPLWHASNRAHLHAFRQRLDITRGFALVTVLLGMILLTTLALGLLSLGTVTLRSRTADEAGSRARANARLAMIMALGELQKQAGPDRRITAEAAILDQTPATSVVDSVPNPHWLGTWDSWGTWLNASYTRTGKPALKISDTYNAGRSAMFRGWLVSGDGMDSLAKAKTATPFGTNGSVRLVAPLAGTDGREVVAGLVPAGSGNKSGSLAWWVGGENLKGDLKLNATPAALAIGGVEASHGNSSARRFAEVDGMTGLSRDAQQVSKLITTGQSTLAGADAAKLKAHYHDLTAGSAGLLTDARWGGLKKDLSLLFEQSSLPSTLARNSTNAPGPRPLSADLTALGPKIPERGFTSFEQMRGFARHYKFSTDSASASWTGSAPFATTNVLAGANGQESDYRRLPLLVKSYCIFNLQTESTGAAYRYYMGYSPVIQLWNPYNVPLEMDSGQFVHTLPYKILNVEYKKYTDAGAQGGWVNMYTAGLSNYRGGTIFQATNGGKIRFKPGQFILFSLKGTLTANGVDTTAAYLTPGFDPGAVGSLRVPISFAATVTPANKPGLALRIQPHISTAGDIVYYYGGNPGSFSQQYGAWGGMAGVTMDWFGDTAGDNTVFAPESGSNRAQFQFTDSEPVPIAAFGVTLKTSEKARYDVTQNDWRARSWLQSAPALGSEQMMAVYGDPGSLARQRLNASLQVHWRSINGAAELGELIPHLGESGFMGSGSATGEKISAAPILEIPTAPVQSLAGYAGLRLQPGWFNYGPRQTAIGPMCNIANLDANVSWQQKVAAYRSGVPGVGVGNSFACPMIAADRVYAYHDISKINPLSDTTPVSLPAPRIDSNAFSDFWDHQLLVNDGLWDSWFTSSLTDARRPTDSSAPALTSLLSKTFRDREALPNANFVSADIVSPTTATTDLATADAYLRAAQYLLNRGAFNVNSTSEDAWFALFSGLRDHAVTYRDANGSLQKVNPPTGSAVVSRFNTETAGAEVSDPRSGVTVDGLPSWSGVRFLNEAQLRRLARECVVQVKTRGPFLNLSDFVNRRLASGDLGTRGALQAAIDYDDASPDSTSINYRYKRTANDMITAADYGYAAYPNPDAAKGSRFTAAPGYVVQSDLLRPLGNSLTVRDDTFRIRAYGDAKDASGNILARVWCEAVIQRMPSYVDPKNAPDVSPTTLDANGNPTANATLTSINQQFGRSLAIVSFRWLTPSEL